MDDIEKHLTEMTAYTERFMTTLADSPTFFPAVAKMLSRLHNALMDEGFTEEQAIRIVSNYKPSGS